MHAPRVGRVALIPAAGGGRRFGGDLPKQYADLGGKPLLLRTIERVRGALALDAVIVALAPDDAYFRVVLGAATAAEPLYCGGATRAETVANALAALGARCRDSDWILVHDAARPCVPPDALRRLVTELADDAVGGLLAVPTADTLKREDPAMPSRVLRTEDRSGLWQAQTPQMFRCGILRAAFALPGALRATDEAEAVEALAAGGACAPPRLIAGSTLNVKITFAADLALAAAILALQEDR
jgi:2-C-methyl-D-erythritol 4-phosphate cytidylyltransferase